MIVDVVAQDGKRLSVAAETAVRVHIIASKNSLRYCLELSDHHPKQWHKKECQHLNWNAPSCTHESRKGGLQFVVCASVTMSQESSSIGTD